MMLYDLPPGNMQNYFENFKKKVWEINIFSTIDLHVKLGGNMKSYPSRSRFSGCLKKKKKQQLRFNEFLIASIGG